MKQSEAEVQQAVRLEASKRGMRLWRNNCGAFKEGDRLVRYGLANESSAVSKTTKSSDLIGITPYAVTPEDAGFQQVNGQWVRVKEPRVLGIFTAIECKKTGWEYKSGDRRAEAQANFLNMIIDMGGFALFATAVGDVWPEAVHGNPGDNGR